MKQKEVKVDLDQLVEDAHKDHGECRSCGWHASFYEMNYIKTGEKHNDEIQLWDTCKAYDSDDHRGCYVWVKE